MRKMWPRIHIGRLKAHTSEGTFLISVSLGGCAWKQGLCAADFAAFYTHLVLSDKSTLSRLQCPLACLRGDPHPHQTTMTSTARLLDEFVRNIMHALDWTLCKPLRHLLGITGCTIYRRVQRAFSLLKARYRARRCRGYLMRVQVKAATRRLSMERHLMSVHETHPSLWKISQACAQLKADPTVTCISIHALVAAVGQDLAGPEGDVVDRLLANARSSADRVPLSHGRLGNISLQRDRTFRFKHERLIHEEESRMMLTNDNTRLEIQLSLDLPSPDRHHYGKKHHGAQRHSHHSTHHHHHRHHHHRHSHHPHPHQNLHLHAFPPAAPQSESERLLDEAVQVVASVLLEVELQAFCYFETLKCL